MTAAPVLDGKGAIWLQIRRALAGAIADGRWAPGTRVPSELSLTAHYGTSRMTVHKAIQSLASEGLVERRRKLGTVVSERAQERPVLEIWDIAAVARRHGGRYAFEVIERHTRTDPEPALMPGLPPGSPLLHVVCVHRCRQGGHSKPLQFEERWVNLAAAPGIARARFTRTPPGRWLLRHVPWTEAEHTVLALPAAGAVAANLELRPGQPCLVVERRTWNGVQPVTFARLWHPGDGYRLVGRFRPSHL